MFQARVFKFGGQIIIKKLQNFSSISLKLERGFWENTENGILKKKPKLQSVKVKCGNKNYNRLNS